ncbi:unnamed protein product, partial [Porites lobata]
IAEKYKFHTGNQEEVQSTHDLLAKLQRLAETVIPLRANQIKLIPLKINHIPCKLELDTGAVVTVIPKEIWQKDLGAIPFKKSNVTLRSYSGHSKPVIGETTVQIKYGAQESSTHFSY